MKPIAITVTAQTAEAAAKLEQFILESGTGLHQLAEHGHEVDESLHKVREGAMLAREGMHTLSEAAEKLGVEKMSVLVSNVLLVREAFLTARTAALLFGTTLTELFPWLAVAGAAIGAAVYAWYEFSGAEAKVEEQTKKTVEELGKIPAILEQINKLEAAKIITPQDAANRRKDLQTKHYRQPDGQIVTEPDTGQMVANDPLGLRGPSFQEYHVENTPLTQAEENKLAIDKMPDVSKEAIDNLVKLRELTHQAHEEVMSAIDKEKAANHDAYEKKREDLRAALANSQAEHSAGGVNLMGPDFSAEATKALAEYDQAEAAKNAEIDATAAAAKNKLLEEAAHKQEELDRTLAAARKSAWEGLEHQLADDQESTREATTDKTKALYQDEYNQKVQLAWSAHALGLLGEQQYHDYISKAQKERAAGEKAYHTDLEKIAATKQEISRADLEAQIKRVESDKTLTTPEKNAQLDPLYAKQILALDEAIADAQKQKTSSTADQLELDKKIHALEREKQDVVDKQADVKKSDTVSGNFTEQWTKMSNQVGSLSQDMANMAMSPFVGMRQGLASAFDQLLEKGTTFKKFMGTIAMDIGKSMIQAFSNMVADWIMSHIVMAGVSAAWHALVTGQQAAATSAQVGIHTAGEAAKTGATAAGAGSRAGIGWLEVTWHAIQTGIKVVAHALGEAAMTAWSFIQSIIRRGIVFLELQPWIIMAGIEAAAAVAGIPFVGPILAPIAAATTIAGLEALAVFSEGGYTGPGGVFDPAGIVHRGEYVFSQASVKRIGLPVLEAMHNGSNSGGGSNGGNPMAAGGNDNIHVYGFTDPNKLMEHFHKIDAHRAFIVDVMSEQAHKLSR